MGIQCDLAFPSSHGGKRPGAGRRRGHRVSHRPRPRFDRPKPVHVTVRMSGGSWNLRSARCFRVIERCLRAALGRFGLRLIEFVVRGIIATCSWKPPRTWRSRAACRA